MCYVYYRRRRHRNLRAPKLITATPLGHRDRTMSYEVSLYICVARVINAVTETVVTRVMAANILIFDTTSGLQTGIPLSVAIGNASLDEFCVCRRNIGR